MRAMLCALLPLTACLAALGQTTAPAGASATRPAPPTSQPSPEAKRAWEQLFSATPPANAAEAVLAAIGKDADALRALIAADAAYPAIQPGWHNHTLKVSDGKVEYDVHFLVRVPRGYDPAKAWPLLLAAHGQDSDGKEMGDSVAWALASERGKYLLVAPTMPGPHVYNGKPYQEDAYLKPLAWARRNLHVDPDRVIVTGYSQGGHCAWHLAVMYGRLFAAAVPMAGVPFFEGSPHTNASYLENLGNLPVWAIWAEHDRLPGLKLGSTDFSRMAAKRLKQLNNDKFTGVEVAGGGHGDCFPKSEEFIAYLARQQRQPVPARVTQFFHQPWHGRGYWLEAVELARKPIDFSQPMQVRLEGAAPPINDEEILAAGARQIDKQLFKLWGELDRPANAATVKAVGVATARIYVTEGMFDLTRPVTLRFAAPLDGARADKTWAGRIPRSARCALAHYADDRDGSAIIWNEVEIDSAGKVTVRFE